MADPLMDTPGQGGEEGMTPAYEICIKVDEAGAISVGVLDATENYAGSDAEVQYTPVGSIKEAITTAMDIYQNNGQMLGSGDDDFNSGFGAPQAPAAGPMAGSMDEM